MTTKTEFDQIFELMDAPDYPCTCDSCRAEGTNASMTDHTCAEETRQATTPKCTCTHSDWQHARESDARLEVEDYEIGQCYVAGCECGEFDEVPAITLSNFRVEYRAPDHSRGHMFDPYCAILADDARFGTVRVFDVPDPNEEQRAVAEFTCRVLNEALRGEPK